MLAGGGGARVFSNVIMDLGAEGAIQRSDDAADQRDRGGSDLLLCHQPAGAFFRGAGRADVPENTVKQAGGFIVQLMPFAEEETIAALEKNLKEITSVTALLDQGYTPERLLEKLLGSLQLEINDKVPAEFYL